MAKTRLKLVSPATVKRTVTPPAAPEQLNSATRTPDPARSREADPGRQGQPLGPRDSTMLLIWPSGMACGRQRCANCSGPTLRLTSGTLHLRRAKGGSTGTASAAGRRTTGAAGAETRGQVALHLRQRAGRALHRVRPAEDGRAGRDRGQDAFQGPSAHAPPCHWLCAGEQGTDTRTLQAYLGHRSIQSRCDTPN